MNWEALFKHVVAANIYTSVWLRGMKELDKELDASFVMNHGTAEERKVYKEECIRRLQAEANEAVATYRKYHYI